ncbi:MAG: VWA domain-containing protein [Chloroflexota bacterium]|nr:VWA domain-containing protein [Chloroflexota bacterium]
MTATARPLSVRQDRRLVRAQSGSTRHLLLHITAPTARAGRPRAAVNLAFVLDRSGSMSGQKIALAKRALEQALARLHDEDRFSVVVYDDQIDLVVESTRASAEAKRNALARLNDVDARGSTNLADGWLRGCEQVGLHQGTETIDRCLLLTDGLANVGITDRRELEGHAAELRARGVSTTTFGLGADFDDVLLQAMADAGGGHFYYVETAQQIPDYLTSEVGETLEVVARDVALAVNAPGVLVEPLTPLPCHRAGEATLIPLGELLSEQELDLVLKLKFPYGTIGQEQRVAVRLIDREGVLGGPTESVTFVYADHRANDAQSRDRIVDAHVARLYANKARQEAVALNRSGAYDRARNVLSAVADRIREYAADDPELLAIIGELERDVPVFAASMAEPTRKTMAFQAYSLAHGRDLQGRARKLQG